LALPRTEDLDVVQTSLLVGEHRAPLLVGHSRHQRGVLVVDVSQPDRHPGHVLVLVVEVVAVTVVEEDDGRIGGPTRHLRPVAHTRQDVTEEPLPSRDDGGITGFFTSTRTVTSLPHQAGAIPKRCLFDPDPAPAQKSEGFEPSSIGFSHPGVGNRWPPWRPRAGRPPEP